MISRISSMISSHATAIPSDEGRVYAFVRRVTRPISPVVSTKDTYCDFARDRFSQLNEAGARPRERDLASNSSLYGYGMILFSASLQSIIIRA